MRGAFDSDFLDGVIARRGTGAGALVPILLDIQERERWIPGQALRAICERTSASPADVAGVLSFYPRFRTRPAGRHLIQVCVGTACHLLGAFDTHAEFLHQLSIPDGEDTDGSLLFTVEQVPCLGCCMLAPAVRIGEHTYGSVGAGRVPDVLADYLRPREGGPQQAKAPGRAATGEGEGGEVRTCLCTSCRSAGAAAVHREIGRQAAALGLPARVISVGCTGLSSEAPLVDVVLDSGESWRYGRMGADQVRSLLLEHFRPHGAASRAGAGFSRFLDRILTSGESDPVIRYRLGRAASGEFAEEDRQVRIATRNAGELSPLDIDAYADRGGFSALDRCRGELTPDSIIDMVTASGLRGRGGAGYPTGRKWLEVRGAGGREVSVVCNGDEGDPGAFMDRMILESFPFRVIEGMAIAAAATGARRGYLYIRGEYSLAIERVGEAIEICARRGYLGKGSRDDGGGFDLQVFEGAGAYVCGEETALIEAMEGRRGMPRVRPPFPSERGLWGNPTLVNNVETFALIPGLVAGGPEILSRHGTPSNSGTKTFALAGRIARSGLIEVPMGTTLEAIVEEIGGGVPEGHTLKAVQVGGPSGGCVPASMAGTPVDYEALKEAGAIMGSGGIIVLDERDCMVDLARYFSAFTRRESCGKCSACRIGTARMGEVLDDICGGRGRGEHLEKLERLALHLQGASLCGLGRTAPNTVLSTLRHFDDEYRAHIEGRCPAGKCKALIAYSIHDGCIGCTRCAQRCPSGAIKVDPHMTHRVDDDACIRCDICRQVCPVDAVEIS